MFKIITWNVNSIRTRIDQLIMLLQKESPAVVLLQEIKCENSQFPQNEIQDLGYNIAIFGQKSYNGVAILSKFPLEDIKYGIPNFEDKESRYIEAVTYFDNVAFKVASIYVPNGSATGEEAKKNIKAHKSNRFQYKLSFMDALKSYLKLEIEKGEHFAIGGDINIAPNDIDVYDVKRWEGKVCFLPEEKLKFHSILNLGFSDAVRVLADNKPIFSWYDYRTRGFDTGKGLRIDHIITSPSVTDSLKNYSILDFYRGLEKPSDHVPVLVEVIL
jgi:exodeoxyribonuclease III